MSDVVLAHDEGPVRVLTLNRPEKLNALNDEMVESLSLRLSDAAGDDAVRVRGPHRSRAIVLCRI